MMIAMVDRFGGDIGLMAEYACAGVYLDPSKYKDTFKVPKNLMELGIIQISSNETSGEKQSIRNLRRWKVKVFGRRPIGQRWNRVGDVSNTSGCWRSNYKLTLSSIRKLSSSGPIVIAVII